MFNAKMVVWHLSEDVMGWMATLIVSTILLFKEIPVLDSIFSILITLYVLYNVAGNLKKTSAVFLQAVSDYIEIGSIKKNCRPSTVFNPFIIRGAGLWMGSIVG